MIVLFVALFREYIASFPFTVMWLELLLIPVFLWRIFYLYLPFKSQAIICIWFFLLTLSKVSWSSFLQLVLWILFLRISIFRNMALLKIQYFLYFSSFLTCKKSKKMETTQWNKIITSLRDVCSLETWKLSWNMTITNYMEPFVQNGSGCKYFCFLLCCSIRYNNKNNQHKIPLIFCNFLSKSEERV